MKLACYIKKASLRTDPRVTDLVGSLQEAGCTVLPVSDGEAPEPGTDAILSIGGDGTFLSAARLAVPSGVPIMGINLGRLGFLSENKPGDDIAGILLEGRYAVEERELLEVTVDGPALPDWTPYALNEMSVSRVGASMLGIDVSVDSSALPTYWADGLLVATSSGSTAYSLSVGGPICLPQSKVLIVAPVSPHNLNVRPLIVPDSSRVDIVTKSRDASCVLTLDNRNYVIPAGTRISVAAAPIRLRRIVPGKSNFINALRSRLLWGEDVRNSGEQY